MNEKLRPHRRAGFTLLELLLAIFISIVILAAVGAAIYFQMRVVDGSKAEIERSQLGRAVMNRIAADLRGAVNYQPMNTQSLAGSLSPAAALGQGGGNQPLPNEALEALQPGGAGGAAAAGGSMESEQEDPTAEAAPPPTPGVYLYDEGTRLELDVSRFPRPDELHPEIVLFNGPPADVKTVAYYVRPPDGGTMGRNYGLVRSELRRAEAQLMLEQGDAAAAESYERYPAPEVVAVTFQFFDGQQWYTEWDTVEMRGLPMAVEVVIYLAPEGVDLDNPGEWWNGLDFNTLPRIRRIVRLPAAELIPPEETPEETEMGEE